MLYRVWKYWCKAMGSRAYDDDRDDNYVHLTIRTFWFLLILLPVCL